MKASENAHDWHCEDHDTYGWRGEACPLCPKARGETEVIEQLEAENKRLREALETYEAIISGNNSLLEVTEHRVQHLEAENKRLRSHIAQLREAVEEGLRTYKVPMTARICEALTATEPKGWCD